MFSIQTMTPEGALSYPSEAQIEVFQETVGMLLKTSLSIELSKLQGTVTVTINPQMAWPALVDFQRRNLSFQKDLFASAKTLAPYLAFELYNFTNQTCFEKAICLLNQGKINPNEYVRLVERIEYGTALKTSLVVHDLITQRKLPSVEDIPYKVVPQKFEDYLALQKASGHTDLIKA